MSNFSIVFVMVLTGAVGFILWAGALAAIARIARKRKERLKRQERLARSILPPEVDTVTGE
jgi:hypothetical protein